MKNSKTNKRTTFGGISMTEELKKKAEEYTKKYINHKMAIHDIFDLEVVQKDVTRLLVDFAREVTKELKELYKKADENWWNAQQTIKALKVQIWEMKCCTEWHTGEPIKGREIFARNIANCNLLADYYDGAWRNVWNGAAIDFDKITMWRYTGFKNNGEEIDCKELIDDD